MEKLIVLHCLLDLVSRDDLPYICLVCRRNRIGGVGLFASSLLGNVYRIYMILIKLV